MPQRIYEIVKRLVFRRTYVGFSVALVSLGLSCFVTPELWEFIASLITSLIQQYFPEAEPSSQPSHDRFWEYIVGLGLIISGISLFVLFYREENSSARYLQIKFEKDNNWVIWSNKGKDSIDPYCRYQIPFTLEAGDIPLRIYTLRVNRLVKGCYCWDKLPTLSLRPRKAEYKYLGDNKTLEEAIRIEAQSSINLLFERDSAGPTRNFGADELEEGEFEFTVEYRFDTYDEIHQDTHFLKQSGGKLTEIDVLSPPPVLSDVTIKCARANKVITDEQFVFLSGITERERFLMIHDGEEYYKSHPNLAYLDERVRECHQRILYESR